MEKHFLYGLFTILLATLFISCGGGGNSKTSNSDMDLGVRISFPSMEEIKEVTIKEVLNPPAPPSSFSLDGKVYDVTVPNSVPLPARVSLPASAELLSSADNKQIVIGRYNGHSWDIIPATINDKRIVADVDHFSFLGVFSSWFQPHNEFSSEFLEGLSVTAPSFKWLLVENDGIFAELELGKSDIAYTSTGERVPVPVNKWELFVQKPDADGTLRPNNGDYKVLPLNNKIDLTGLFDFSTVMTLYDKNTTPGESFLNFSFKIRPIFNDDNSTKGKLSKFTMMPVGVADVHFRLKQGLIARLNDKQRKDFIKRVSSTPLLLPYGKGWGELYASPLGWRKTANLFLQGVSYPLIGINNNTEWVRVVSHEWGHYASHMLMGDDWTENASAGTHVGWKEASSRQLAWSEDLATFLGQWGVNNTFMLPNETGAMNGCLTDYSKRPEAVGNESINTYWPNDKNMDAIKVESISASILSRLSLEYSFSKVMGVILKSKPTTLAEFIDEWFKHFGMKSIESLFLQNLCIDEGVTWALHGRIVDAENNSTSLKGVIVSVNGIGGALSVADRYSDTNGDFTITVPPGNIKVKFTYPKYTSLDDRIVKVKMDFGTNLGYADSKMELNIQRSGLINFLPATTSPFRMELDSVSSIPVTCQELPTYCAIRSGGKTVIRNVDVDANGETNDVIQCSFTTTSERWLVTEMPFLFDTFANGGIRHGSHKRYTHGRLATLRQYISGKQDGYSISCNTSSVMDDCSLWADGKFVRSCMP